MPLPVTAKVEASDRAVTGVPVLHSVGAPLVLEAPSRAVIWEKDNA